MILIYFLLLFQNYSEQDYVAEISKTKDISKVETIYQEANKLYPESYNINLNTAYKYLLLKKYKKSYVLYKKSYVIYPAFDALLGLTYTQVELNKFKELLKVTSTYKYKNKELEKWIYLRRSYAYLRLENYDNAIIEANRGLKKYPDFKELIKNKKYALKMKPRLLVDIIPIWGMVNYKNTDNKISYSYWGGVVYSRYGAYNLDLGYTQATIENQDETLIENNLDFGIGYNKNYNTYFHLKKIFLDSSDAIIPYLHLGYNFKKLSLITAFSVSYYEYLSNLVYQGGLYSYFYLFNKKVIPSLGLGYKYLKRDKNTSLPYFEIGLNLYFIENLGIKTLFRYGEHSYFVSYGGIVYSSLDDVNWMFEGGIDIKLSDFTVSPIYRYYSMNIPFSSGQMGKKNTSSKSFFTVVLGYKF